MLVIETKALDRTDRDLVKALAGLPGVAVMGAKVHDSGGRVRECDAIVFTSRGAMVIEGKGTGGRRGRVAAYVNAPWSLDGDESVFDRRLPPNEQVAVAAKIFGKQTGLYVARAVMVTGPQVTLMKDPVLLADCWVCTPTTVPVVLAEALSRTLTLDRVAAALASLDLGPRTPGEHQLKAEGFTEAPAPTLTSRSSPILSGPSRPVPTVVTVPPPSSPPPPPAHPHRAPAQPATTGSSAGAWAVLLALGVVVVGLIAGLMVWAPTTAEVSNGDVAEDTGPADFRPGLVGSFQGPSPFAIGSLMAVDLAVYVRPAPGPYGEGLLDFRQTGDLTGSWRIVDTDCGGEIIEQGNDPAAHTVRLGMNTVDGVNPSDCPATVWTAQLVPEGLSLTLYGSQAPVLLART